MQKNFSILNFLQHQSKWRLFAVLVAVAGALFLLKMRAKPKDIGTTFVARRGPLEITVLDGGGLESEEKGELKCEVKGGQGVKILKIVEEGYQVTDQDVKTNKLLVELDSADLRSKITQQEITFGSTAASLIDAEQAYDIQLNQNLSDVKAAEQKMAFARMDFDKYLGDRAANEILARLNSQTEAELPSTARNNPISNSGSQAGPSSATLNRPVAPIPLIAAVAAVKTGAGAALSSAAELSGHSASNEVLQTQSGIAADRAAMAVNPANIDFSQYADISLLGDGEAKQKLRELQDAVQIAQKELQQAQSTVEGTRRLFEKDFVTKIELDRDQLACDNSVLKVKKAETALNLFAKYEFRKAAQEAMSKYTESLRELDRNKKGAISKLAQADAKLKSAQARYAMEQTQLKELKEQLEKCAIKAPRPGLVVYGSGGDTRYWRDEEQIREGASVREGQTILTIPDLRKMCIKVKIHESYIKKVLKGQKVSVTADAFPDRKLEGEVSQVGVLPDSENSWLNPDMKVYRTTISIKGQHDWIRPGMSTKVQILVNQLSDVVYVPLQAISALTDQRVCYVVEGRGKLEQRAVEVGEFNDDFIEVRNGLKAGERVCLRKPADLEEKENGPEGNGTKKPSPGTPPQPKTVAARASANDPQAK